MIKNTNTMIEEVCIMQDALNSIKNEVNQEYSSEHYLREKLETIEFCIGYLKACILDEK